MDPKLKKILGSISIIIVVIVVIVCAVIFIPKPIKSIKLVGKDTDYPEQGQSVNISGDGNTLVIGGTKYSGGLGATWTFTKDKNNWTQLGSEVATREINGFSFQGWSVSLSKDGNTLAVGGPMNNDLVGSVWIFTKDNGSWIQQGSGLVGNDYTEKSLQGWSVSLSDDGNTLAVGGPGDNKYTGATWIFTRSGTTWTQQGPKLVGIGHSAHGWSVSLSGDGNTLAVGGPYDNEDVGSTFIFTRNAGVWTQQGDKLVGTAVSGRISYQGSSVSLSNDGNTLAVGGLGDNGYIGATWIFTRNETTWTQQGDKLVGKGYVGRESAQGESVSLSNDGNTLAVGGPGDNGGTGAAWIFKRSGTTWTQKGSKLVGTKAIGKSAQGKSVSLSGDGKTLVVGGPYDDEISKDVESPIHRGATWIFTLN